MLARMYRFIFKNSKIALLFAFMTIMSAVSMVGTSEKSGVVVQAASMVAGEGGRAAGATGLRDSQDEGAKSGTSVFGDYDPHSAPADADINPIAAPIDPADTRTWLANLMASVRSEPRGAGKKRPFIDAW